MAQDTVIIGKDNPVILVGNFNGDFAAEQFDTFSRITLSIGGENYSTDTTPQQLFVFNKNQLRLVIGDTTSLEPGRYDFELVGFSPTYDDGYLIHGEKRKILNKIRVV